MSNPYLLRTAGGWDLTATLESATPPYGGLVLRDVSHAGYFLARDIRVNRIWVGESDPHKDRAKANLKSFLLGSPQLKPVVNDIDAPVTPPTTPVIIPYAAAKVISAEFTTVAPPLGPKSGKLMVGQRYVLTPYSSNPAHEPGGVLPAARLYPLLDFTYYPGKEPDDRPPRYLRADLRIEASVDPFQDLQGIKKGRAGGGQPWNQAGLFLDSEKHPWYAPPLTIGTMFQAAEKPVLWEVIGQGLLHGKKADWDNVHQWGWRGTGYLPATPGAFHALHLHWRWGAESVLGGTWPAKLAAAGKQFGGPVTATGGAQGTPGQPLIDADNPDQNIRFALVATTTRESDATPGNWLRESNGSEANFDDLFTPARSPAYIGEGARLAIFISVEVLRSEASAVANVPWTCTLFPHGLFFSHMDEWLPLQLVGQNMGFYPLSGGVGSPLQKGPAGQGHPWVRPLGSKNQP